MDTATLLRTLQADFRRHVTPDMPPLQRAQVLVGSQGVWATVVMRLGQWIYEPRGRAGLAWLPGKIWYKVAAKGIELATGISVPASARIGPGFYIGHFGTIFVHPDAVMGSGCSIGQGVTIGTRGLGDKGVPRIGDGVYIGAGAKVLGGVTVGDGASVGANAVVVRDVPPAHVALGVPAVARPARRG